MNNHSNQNSLPVNKNEAGIGSKGGENHKQPN